MKMSSEAFAHRVGMEDGQAQRSRTTGWRDSDAKAYEAGYKLGKDSAWAVAGLLGVCTIWDDPETGERRVEYLNEGKQK